MIDNYVMIVAGILLMPISFVSTGISYGMPGKLKPVYPVTLAQRIVMFLFGLLSLVLGLTRVLRH